MKEYKLSYDSQDYSPRAFSLFLCSFFPFTQKRETLVLRDCNASRLTKIVFPPVSFFFDVIFAPLLQMGEQFRRFSMVWLGQGSSRADKKGGRKRGDRRKRKEKKSN